MGTLFGKVFNTIKSNMIKVDGASGREGDIFKYDHERARDYLDKKGISEKYCIVFC